MQMTRGEIDTWLKFIQSEAHVLRELPGLLVQQAANRPAGDPLATAAQAYLKRAPRSFLRWINKPSRPDPCLMTLAGEDELVAVVWTSDGSRLVSVSRAYRYLRVCDAQTGETLSVLRGVLDHEVQSCALSPDDRVLVVVGGDSEEGEVKVVDIQTGELRFLLKGHEKTVSSVAFSPDGTLILTASYDRTLRLWDSRTGRQVRQIRDTHPVTCCAFSPDGSEILGGGWSFNLGIWDTKTGEQRARLEGHESWVDNCTFSPDGRFIASASFDHTVRVWDAASGAGVHRLEGHTSHTYCCDFSPDGSRLVSGSNDNMLRLWDCETGEPLAVLAGHGAGVNDCRFSPSGDRIASGSKDGSIKVWVVGSEGSDAARAFDWGVWSCEFTPNGRRLVTTGHLERLIKVWDTEQLALTCTISPESELRWCSISSNSELVASAHHDGTVKTWRLDGGDDVGTLASEGPLVRCLFTPDGSRVVSAEKIKRLRLWDAETGEEIAVMEASSQIDSLAVSPDGCRVAAGYLDTKVRVWDLVSHALVAELAGQTSIPAHCEFSPDGRAVLSFGRDQFARVWEVDSGESLAELGEHRFNVTAAAWSPDGSRIVTAESYDPGVFIWSTSDWSLERKLTGHSRNVEAAAFTPDGRWVITAARDGSVRVWSVETGGMETAFVMRSEMASFPAARPQGALDITGGGRLIATGDHGGWIYFLEGMNLELEPPLVTAVRLYRFARGEFDARLTVVCAWCGERAEASAEPGTAFSCDKCGRMLKLNPFKVEMIN